MKGDRDRLKMLLFSSFLRGKLRDGSLDQQNLRHDGVCSTHSISSDRTAIVAHHTDKILALLVDNHNSHVSR